MPRLQPCDTAAGVCDESRSWLVVADPNNRQEAQGRLTDSMHVLDNGGQLSRAWALEWGDQAKFTLIPNSCPVCQYSLFLPYMYHRYSFSHYFPLPLINSLRDSKGNQVRSLQRHKPVKRLHWQPSAIQMSLVGASVHTSSGAEQIIAVACWDQTLSLYERSGREVCFETSLDFDPNSITHLRPSGRTPPFCIVGGSDRKASLWSTGAHLTDVHLTSSHSTVAHSTVSHTTADDSTGGTSTALGATVCLATIAAHTSSLCTCVAHGHSVALGYEDGTIAFQKILFESVWARHKDWCVYRGAQMTDVIVRKLGGSAAVRIEGAVGRITKVAVHSHSGLLQHRDLDRGRYRDLDKDRHSRDLHSRDLHNRNLDSIRVAVVTPGSHIHLYQLEEINVEGVCITSPSFRRQAGHQVGFQAGANARAKARTEAKTETCTPNGGLRLKQSETVPLALSESAHLLLTSIHLIVTHGRRLQCHTLQGVKEREWLFDSQISHLRDFGGPVGREAILVGCQDGVVIRIFVDSPFVPPPLINTAIKSTPEPMPEPTLEHGGLVPLEHGVLLPPEHRAFVPPAAVRYLDVSASRNMLAVVDASKRLAVYNLKGGGHKKGPLKRGESLAREGYNLGGGGHGKGPPERGESLERGGSLERASLIFEAEGVEAAAWNRSFDQMLAFSGGGAARIWTGASTGSLFPIHCQRLVGGGAVVGFERSHMAVLQHPADPGIRTIEVTIRLP